jgi:hypothetical protein
MRMRATLVQFWRLGHVVDRVVIRVAIFEPVIFAFLLPIVPTLEFGLPELLVASHVSRLASRDAVKSLLSTLVSESSGECRLIPLYNLGYTRWPSVDCSAKTAAI